MAQRAHRRCGQWRKVARAGASKSVPGRPASQGVGIEMHQFEIWAPRVEKIAVQVNGVYLPMSGPDEEGWWRLCVEEAGAGTDYGFIVNDESAAYPDPRSLHQPHGVHGLSRVYDQGAFRWTDGGFQPPPLPSAVGYELQWGP